MLSGNFPQKAGRGQSCSACRGRKIKCVLYDSSTCSYCRKNALTCHLPKPKARIHTNEKRKKQEADVISDSESIGTKRAASAGSVSNAQIDVQPIGPPRKKSRPAKQQSKSTDICGICHGDRRSAWKNTLDTDTMVRCELKSCQSWYHLSCICILLSRKPTHVLFSPSTSLKETIFLCPKCLDQHKGGYDQAVLQAMKVFFQTIEEIKKVAILDQPGSSGNVKSGLQDNAKNQSIPQKDRKLGILQAQTTEFEPAREERYQGVDERVVARLIRQLHQSIYDYDLEVRQKIERFGNESDLRTSHPLHIWNFIDAGTNIAAGQAWFDTNEAAREPFICHAPITNALRRMFQTTIDKPLDIDPRLRDLNFSQVHTGLVAWFVFDILNNEVNMYDLGNMKAMRAMMAAVNESGEARWPSKGLDLLREVQLRTWDKTEFQKAILLNEELFRYKMDAFLEPLTRDFDKINSWSHARSDVIECTIKLWSYLQSLGGTLEILQPAIGSEFDPQFHDAYDESGEEQSPQKGSKKKILWILSRGIRYEEKDLDGPCSRIIKARVIVQ